MKQSSRIKWLGQCCSVTWASLLSMEHFEPTRKSEATRLYSLKRSFMNLILQSLVPLAFVISLGWFAGWRQIIDARHSSSLATYVMSFSFPCLLFAKTATTSLQNLINYRFIAGMSLALIGCI